MTPRQPQREVFEPDDLGLRIAPPEASLEQVLDNLQTYLQEVSEGENTDTKR